MSCNELCIFLATARMLREDCSAPSQIDAEGHLDATQIFFLQSVTENVEHPPPEAEGNLSPDYLTDAREKISAEQSSHWSSVLDSTTSRDQVLLHVFKKLRTWSVRSRATSRRSGVGSIWSSQSNLVFSSVE